MLILLFAVKLGFFPTGGYVPFSEDPLGWAGTIIMPALTLAIIQVGFVARMTRASMLEILNQDFIRTADAKGLKRAEIMLRHGLPECLDPDSDSRRNRRRRAARRRGDHRAGVFDSRRRPLDHRWDLVPRLPGDPRWIAVSGGHLSDGQLAVDILYAVVDPRVRLE